MEHNFIMTTDEEVARALTACGFELIKKSSDGCYTFLNKKDFSYAAIVPRNQVVETNTICC